jgi:histidine ammonia-lyase
MAVVTITEAPMAIEDLQAIVRGAHVELGLQARARITASRDVVERALASGEPVYGLTTGVGHGKDTRLPDEELRRHQETLLLTHAGGIGDALPVEVVRAAMAVRLNGIARGGSGASLPVAELLAAMLNAGVHPILPERGSVGAGDLSQMATIGLVAIGTALAIYDGEVLPGGDALARAGLAPITLQPKDGLALMSSNGLSVGLGALVVLEAEAIAELADVAAALSLEAIQGNPSVTRAVVAEAKPAAGLSRSAEAMRDALAGSYLWEEDAPRSIQDALSFRVAPQVHGAFRAILAFVRESVDVELNARSDNPLVSIENGEMIHNGNFQPALMAMAFESLRLAAAHVAQLSDRRMSHLWEAFFEKLTNAAPLVGRPPELPGLSLRYPAAATLAELAQLAAPATLQSSSLDHGLEDHSTNALLSVQRTRAAVDLLNDVLIVELLLARDVLHVTEPGPRLGTGTTATLSVLDDALRARDDRSPSGAHRIVKSALARRDR